MAERDEIVKFANEYLCVHAFDDYGPQGLQHVGNPNVFSIASCVSVTWDVIAQAYKMGAQMLLAHHGLYWKGDPHAIDGAMAMRIDSLGQSNMNLLGYHLCLDANPEIGNNMLAIKAMGVTNPEPFCEIGWGGHVDFDPDFNVLDSIKDTYKGTIHFATYGPTQPKKVCVVTGKGASYMPHAIREGYDLFLTGEPTEPAKAQAKEAKISFVAAGHYETEKAGVQALGKLIANEFGIVHNFVEDPENNMI